MNEIVCLAHWSWLVGALTPEGQVELKRRYTQLHCHHSFNQDPYTMDLVCCKCTLRIPRQVILASGGRQIDPAALVHLEEPYVRRDVYLPDESMLTW